MAIVSDVQRHLLLFIRYQTTADRAFHKAHAELLKLQKERKNSQNVFESKKAEVKAQEPVDPPQKIANPPIVIPKTAPESPAPKEMARETASSMEELRASGR